MPFDGYGTFLRLRSWVVDATNSVKIRADFHDDEDNGFAEGLSHCITKDGQTTITQNIPFNSRRIISLADPIDLQDAATKDYTDTHITAAVTAAVPPGAVMDFAMAAAPAGWLACDGVAVSRTVYAALFTAVGTTWGAGDGSTTFNLPDMVSRYRRHRDGASVSGSVGNTQASQNLSHTHNVNGNTGTVSTDHTHHIDFMSQANDRSLNHTHLVPQQEGVQASAPDVSTSGGQYVHPNDDASGPPVPSLDHLHRILGDTGGISANHSHGFSATSGGGSADGAEARPLSATVLTCIKT